MSEDNQNQTVDTETSAAATRIERWMSIAVLTFTPNHDYDGAWPFSFDAAVSISLMPTFIDPHNIVATLSKFGRNLISSQPLCIAGEYDVPIGDQFDVTALNEARAPKLRIHDNLSWVNLMVWLSQRGHFGYHVVLNLRKHAVEQTWMVIDAIELTSIFTTAHQLLPYSQAHFVEARDMYLRCAAAPEPSPLALAISAQFRALSEHSFQIRYLLHWLVLEALFGPTSPTETTFKLTQRLGFFLANGDRPSAKLYVDQATTSYRLRSTIVHGRPIEKKMTEHMLNHNLAVVELLVHEALNKILRNPEIAKAFHDDKTRDEYLKQLIYL